MNTFTAEAQRTQSCAEKEVVVPAGGKVVVSLKSGTSHVCCTKSLLYLCGPLRTLRLCGKCLFGPQLIHA
jgi:hypothetical protein